MAIKSLHWSLDCGEPDKFNLHAKLIPSTSTEEKKPDLDHFYGTSAIRRPHLSVLPDALVYGSEN